MKSKNKLKKSKKRKFKISRLLIKLICIAFILVITLEIYEKINSSDITTEKTNYVKIENVLKEENEKSKPIPKDSHLKVNVIGDIMCHNTQYMDAYDNTTKTYDFSYVFEEVQEATSEADIFMGNLETTFAGAEKGYSNYPHFNTPEQLAIGLKEMGIDILTTANNHCMDTGYDGLESTLNYLDEAEIEHTGTNRSVEEQNKVLIKEVNGIKIAFLSFTYGTNGIAIPSDKSYAVNLIDEEFVLSQIELAQKENPDLIFASVHWGIEYQNTQNENQEKWADFLIKNGVSIVLGSHPHVLQPMEYREVQLENGETRKGFVIYSLGNFMSGQTQKNTRTSIILNLDITKKGDTSAIFIDDISYIPIYTYKGSGNKKYKIVNIDTAIKNYENESDRSIGQSNYILFKEEVARLRKLLEI